jgi:nitroreductase
MTTILQAAPDQTIHSPAVAPKAARSPDHEIAPFFFNRWSSRAFSNAEISDDILFQLFEAARWAPSGSNRQPWRFIYTKRNSPRWPVFVDLLNERNRIWASKAAAIVFVTSHSTAERDGKLVPSQTHAFDAGAAWLSLALQANLLGWNTRAMGGIDRARSRTALDVPDDFAVNVAIAIGKPGAKDDLHEEFHGGETPNSRRPLRDIIAEGSFQRA